jgi:predicted deacetylase
MRPAYLLRFDDLCPTMNWEVWGRVEAALQEVGATPLLAVIPDNRDPSLHLGPPDPSFWERVRGWQRRGWTIALHGHHHVYLTRDRGLFGWNHRSEFAGLPRDRQEEKLRQAAAVFEREGVVPEVWVAPNHSFDATTVDVLRELGIDTISDGTGLFPYRDPQGTMWIPMQLWRFAHRPVGTWTVCLHPNAWGPAEVDRFTADLRRFAPRLTTVPELVRRYGGRRRGLVDRAFTAQRRAKRAVAARVRRARG